MLVVYGLCKSFAGALEGLILGIGNSSHSLYLTCKLTPQYIIIFHKYIFLTKPQTLKLERAAGAALASSERYRVAPSCGEPERAGESLVRATGRSAR